MGKLILAARRPSTRSAVVIGFQGLVDLFKARVDVIALLEELAAESRVSSFSSAACSPEQPTIVSPWPATASQGRLVMFPKSPKANATEPHEGWPETGGG